MPDPEDAPTYRQLKRRPRGKLEKLLLLPVFVLASLIWCWIAFVRPALGLFW